jgi:hypothetical protein
VPTASSFHDDWVGGTPASDYDEYSHSNDSDQYSNDFSYAIADRKHFEDPKLQIIAAHGDAT